MGAREILDRTWRKRLNFAVTAAAAGTLIVSSSENATVIVLTASVLVCLGTVYWLPSAASRTAPPTLLISAIALEVILDTWAGLIAQVAVTVLVAIVVLLPHYKDGISILGSQYCFMNYYKQNPAAVGIWATIRSVVITVLAGTGAEMTWRASQVYLLLAVSLSAIIRYKPQSAEEDASVHSGGTMLTSNKVDTTSSLAFKKLTGDTDDDTKWWSDTVAAKYDLLPLDQLQPVVLGTGLVAAVSLYNLDDVVPWDICVLFILIPIAYLFIAAVSDTKGKHVATDIVALIIVTTSIAIAFSADRPVDTAIVPAVPACRPEYNVRTCTSSLDVPASPACCCTIGFIKMVGVGKCAPASCAPNFKLIRPRMDCCREPRYPITDHLLYGPDMCHCSNTVDGTIRGTVAQDSTRCICNPGFSGTYCEKDV